MISKNFHETVIKCKHPEKCLGDLLFIHGFCVDRTYFVADRQLSEHFNVYTIDLPGHGTHIHDIVPKDLTLEKIAQHIIDYIEYRKLDNLILVGHSMGGGLASIVATKIPTKIRKLILCCPYNAAVMFAGLKAFYIFYPKNMKQKYRLLDILYKDYTMYLNDPNWVKMNENQLDFQLAHWDKMKKLYKHMSSIKTIRKIRKTQKCITSDTLLLVGKHDRVIPAQRTINGFKRYIPGLQHYTFANSGHLIFEEEQETFVQKVLEFVSPHKAH